MGLMYLSDRWETEQEGRRDATLYQSAAQPGQGE